MQILLTTVVTVVVALASAFGVYNYLPLGILGFEHEGVPRFGATITNIAGTDTLSSSRTTINDNFTNLNNGKIENSTTSVAAITTLSNLVTVGTLTSGSLGSGFTAVVVARGGTGSTTLSSNQVLLGNGTGNIGTVSGWGSSGQFLTSGGGVAAPTWTTSAVSLSDNYTWTGTHTFNTATTTHNGGFAIATSSQFGVDGGGLAPPGSILAYASTTAPAGWLLANGASYPTASFARLFTVIGYKYGGSGANFNVPDIQNRNILMASTTVNLAQTGGEANHTLLIAEMPSHNHSATRDTGAGNDAGQALTGGGGTESALTISSTGGDGAHNVLDPYIVLYYIIKY